MEGKGLRLEDVRKEKVIGGIEGRIYCGGKPRPDQEAREMDPEKEGESFRENLCEKRSASEKRKSKTRRRV